jgi:hypothetical protein
MGFQVDVPRIGIPARGKAPRGDVLRKPELREEKEGD